MDRLCHMHQSLLLSGNEHFARRFRRIAVLFMVYRVWASIRARESLSFLAQFAPPHMYGMLPGRSSRDVWYGLQQAHLSGEVICVTTDLEKAFNFLPRVPVFAYAVHLGLPPPVVRAWTSAVGTLQRRFKVRGCVGPPISSLTGFSEGDPISCVAMTIVCLGFHAHLRATAPLATAVSYVDNWEAFASSPPAIVQAHESMQSFAAAWDLALDRAKTVFWANSAPDRRWLRDRGVAVIHQARDLGGHLQYTRYGGQPYFCDGRNVAPPCIQSRWLRCQTSSHCYCGLAACIVWDLHLQPWASLYRGIVHCSSTWPWHGSSWLQCLCSLGFWWNTREQTLASWSSSLVCWISVLNSARRLRFLS